MKTYTDKNLANLPNCAKLLDRVVADFPFLFEKYGINIIDVQEGQMYGACNLVVSTGSMNIMFLRDRGTGYETWVGPSGTMLSSPDWVPVSEVLDFLDNHYPVYQGPGFIDKRVILAGGLRRSLEKAQDFYTNEYNIRHEEFLRWQSESRRVFRESVEQYDAARRRQDQGE